jgi:superfamily II DNA or RNA helicase
MSISQAPPSLRFSSGTLVLEGISPDRLRDIGGRTVWRWDERVGAYRANAMEYRRAIELLRGLWGNTQNEVPRWQRVQWPEVNLPSLREEQQSAVNAWLQGRRGVVVMPTGTGKTEVALSIMRETSVSTLVVSPVRDLMYQWHRRILNGLGYDSGIIGDNIHRVRAVSVTTYDSALIHMERFGNQFALIIFDECHHLPGPMRGDAARMCAAPFRLGLTATPERSDGRHVDLEELIGPTVYTLALKKVRGKSLAEYDVVRIPVKLSDEEQQRYNAYTRRLQQFMADKQKEEPGFTFEDLCAASNREPAARRALADYRAKKSIEERAEEKLRVLEDIFRLHVGSPTIVFVGSNAMARDVSRRFLIPCLLSHCRKQERYETLEGLANGTFPAVVANQVLDEGVDVPACKVAVVIGGGASTRQSRQRLGRILRKTGNARATLYEVVCEDTTEEKRSRQRRGTDAFEGTRHRRV